MRMQPASGTPVQLGPALGASRDWRRRLLLHHLPLAAVSAVVLALFTGFSPFDVNRYARLDMSSGPLPQAVDYGEGDGLSTNGESAQTEPSAHGRGDAPQQHGGDQNSGSQTKPSDGGEEHEGGQNRAFTRQFTVATGYMALGLVGITLLIGPANLVLRRRNPISSYLRRDIGTWAAIGSIVHVIFGLQVHASGRISDFLNYFFAPDGSPLTNSFGLGNWIGLAATVVVVGLLAISSDAALHKLKARSWKRLQRMNYALFALVVLHAFYYGALLRMTSPFTLLLIVTVLAVSLGQAVGIWQWRRRHARNAIRVAGVSSGPLGRLFNDGQVDEPRSKRTLKCLICLPTPMSATKLT